MHLIESAKTTTQPARTGAPADQSASIPFMISWCKALMHKQSLDAARRWTVTCFWPLSGQHKVGDVLHDQTGRIVALKITDHFLVESDVYAQ